MGCPYDNAPMERHFNTSKYLLIFELETELELDPALANLHAVGITEYDRTRTTKV